jgi:gamma-glutamyl-gamma-aminobutyrate hydrolase PuuD
MHTFKFQNIALYWVFSQIAAPVINFWHGIFSARPQTFNIDDYTRKPAKFGGIAQIERSSPMRPVIGIVPSYSTGMQPGEESFIARERYALSIEAAGGAPIVLPITQLDDVCERIFPMIDGFLLTGGQDITPARYGCHVCPLGTPLEPQREELEYRVIKYCYENDVPLMGICRGMQIMNVYFGGTLVADLPTAAAQAAAAQNEGGAGAVSPGGEGVTGGGAGASDTFGVPNSRENFRSPTRLRLGYSGKAGIHAYGSSGTFGKESKESKESKDSVPDKFGHASPSAVRLSDEQMASLDSLNGVDVEHWQKCDYAKPTHPVSVVPNTKLSGLLGTTLVDTNSMHHQGICKLGRGLAPVAYGPDGLVEAIEVTGRKFMLGVQWHPEFMKQDMRMGCLFSSLISACK